LTKLQARSYKVKLNKFTYSKKIHTIAGKVDLGAGSPIKFDLGTSLRCS
jgi:hypothetical protein